MCVYTHRLYFHKYIYTYVCFTINVKRLNASSNVKIVAQTNYSTKQNSLDAHGNNCICREIFWGFASSLQ